MKNLTSYFLDKLFPPLERIMYTPRTNYLTNNIIHKNVVVYGKPGSGKTETIRAIAERAVAKYGPDNVNASMVYNGELELLLEYGLDDRLIQLLFADNVTLVKPRKVDIQNFFKIRHYFRMLTGKNNGLIITFLAAHRFYGIDISLRTNFDLLIARNSPTNPWDYNIMKRFLGEEGISLMEVLEEERETRRNLYKYSVFYSKRRRGVLELPLAQVNYLRPIDNYTLPRVPVLLKEDVYNGNLPSANIGLRL